MAERAGYTVTMFVIDVSKSMNKMRAVDLPDGPNGEPRTGEMTNLEWSLQYVLLKIQEMIFHGRKTEQCGVILFGTPETDNIINESNGGYDHVTEYIQIAQPNGNTLNRLQELQASEEITGDPIDAIIVSIETQDKYLAKKPSWTRKMVLLTDGESPIVLEDWELTARKIKKLGISTSIIGVDFDDENFAYQEEDKSDHKRENEKFYAEFVSELGPLGVMGTCAFALQECVRPDVKITKSALLGTVLRLGDVDRQPEESIELLVKVSKCTAQVRPPSMKKFAKRIPEGEAENEGDVDMEADGDANNRDIYAQLKMDTEYVIDRKEADEGEGEGEDKKDEDKGDDDDNNVEKVDRDSLVRGFKYGATYVPCPDDGQFPRQENNPKGMDICGFFPLSDFRRDFAMGEVQYVWAEPSSGEQQIKFSSLVQGMLAEKLCAIVRTVSRDGMDPKMGVLVPREFERVDCFLWLQMPFADDVRKYTFPSLINLTSKKGEEIKEHAFIPTVDQIDSMDDFVDALDLMAAGEKDENGDRQPWFDPALSFNPAVHRMKQALFHAAVVTDLRTNPVPEPHPEVIKYMYPPKRVLKRAQDAIEKAKDTFKVKQVPKKVVRARKDGHVRAEDDEDAPLLLDLPKAKGATQNGSHPSQSRTQASEAPSRSATLVNSQVSEKPKSQPKPAEDSETEDEDEPDAWSGAPKSTPASTLKDESQGVENGSKSSKRIIGFSTPLEDFQKNIKQGDIVSKAVEDFAWVIKEILLRPFASRRHSECLECMRTLRSTCLNEDEVDVWNKFIQDLKQSCLSTSGISNRPFWKMVQSDGREISLISGREASELGGTSEFTEEESVEFVKD